MPFTDSKTTTTTKPTEGYTSLSRDALARSLETLAAEITHIATDKGFWPKERTPEELAEEFVGEEPRFALNIHEFRKKAAEFAQLARDTAPRNEPEMIALEVSELAEALEGIRHKNPPSNKIPEFSQVEEELADCVIRCLDHCHSKGYRLTEAIFAKIEYNRSRPYKHGKTC